MCSSSREAGAKPFRVKSQTPADSTRALRSGGAEERFMFFGNDRTFDSLGT
jgi:hypothetical protein